MEKNGSTSSPRRRSVGVTIFAIIILVFGVYSLLASILSFKADASAVIKFVGFLLSMGGIVCGIGLLKLKERARRFTIYLYGFSAIWATFIILVVRRKVWTEFSASLPPEVPIEAAKVVMTLSLIGAIAFGLFWFIIILLFFTRPKVKRQFVKEGDRAES